MAILYRYARISLQVGLLAMIATIGNALAIWLHWPVPGNVVGTALLFVMLLIGVVPITWVEEGADFLLRNMLLFFIPAAVGFVQYPDLMATRGFGIVAVIALSTALVMGLAGVAADRLAHRSGKEVSGVGRS